MKSSDERVISLTEFEQMPRCKCCFANVYFCIIDKIT